MADRVQYLEYAVYLDDKARAEAYQAAYPLGVRIAPDALATALAATEPGIAVVLHSLTTPFTAPSIRSPYFTATSKYPRNVAEFTICRGGWFGICALFGRDTLYKWVAKYYWVPTPVPEVEGVPVGAPAAMGARSWIDGFEMKADNAAGTWGGANKPPVNRGSSRHVDGMGFAAHGIDDIGEYFIHDITENGAANRRSSWERFYMRVRTAPASTIEFWLGSTSTGNGGALALTPGLQIAVQNVDGVGTRTLLGVSSSALVLDTWAKVDVLYEKSPAGPSPGRIRIFIKGVLVLDISVPNASGGIGNAGDHGGSKLGCVNQVYGSMAIDFDDWSCQPIPATLDGLDWLNGSKCSLVSPTGFGTGNQFATGDWRSLLRNPFDMTTNPGSQVSHATISTALIVTTDAEYSIDRQNGALGCSAIKVRLLANGLTGTSQIGYSINGAAAVMTNFAEPNSVNVPAWRTAMYRPAQSAFADVTPLTLNFIREATAGTKRAFGFHAEAELIGTFGDEDVKEEAVGTVTAMTPPRLGPHNAPYPTSIWARLAIPPTAPVIVIAGTYTGNGTGQDLTFRAPVNFFMSRRVPNTGTRQGTYWWTSLLAAHAATNQGIAGQEGMAKAAADESFVPIGGVNDPEERYVVRIAGGESNSNENTIAYQYVAVIDPGARFFLNGSLHHQNAASMTETLKKPTFTPEGLFIFLEDIGEGGAVSLFFKGPGAAATGAAKFDSGGEIAAVVTMSAGSLVTGAAGQLPEGTHFSYSAWRTNDGSGDPNVHKVVKIGTYTGNGSGSRTITFGPASGLRPLVAIITPNSAAPTIKRDPSNTGTTSEETSGSQNAATGITSGGIDEMTVGSALNTNTVVYNYWVLMGSATAGNNGWSINGEFAYVEPDYDGALTDPPLFVDPDAGTEDPDPDPDPGPSDEDDCDAGEVCVEATTREVNIALLEIGSTKFLTNYCTQQTLEAQTARVLYEVSVRAVLHRFPWPFATKYAALLLTVAQPTHQDWAFSYRLPVDCIFPRRLVIDRGPGVDPKGPGFELSSDAAGGILLTNEASAVLEYTCRPSCVAYTGDALFREAVKWHLAAAMAPPLTRMADKAKFCRDEYERCIENANAIIKPGQPGLRTALSGDDAAGACQTSNTMVANVALVRIGANTVANLSTDQSREAVAVTLIFEHELRATLRDFPWKFAKRYNDALVTVAGSASVPANVDWQYSYRLPADYVGVRRLATTGTGRSFEVEPKTFEVGTDATGYLLFTGELDPNLEYTARIPCAVAKADDLFRDAFAWRLASSLAPSLASRDPEEEEARGRGPEYPHNPEQRVSHKPNKAAMRERAARYAMAMYLRVIEKARVVDANEAEPEEPGESPWITGRD